MGDLREEILKTVAGRAVTAVVLSDGAGVVAGVEAAAEQAQALGLRVVRLVGEGSSVREGDELARLCGGPKQIAAGEDALLGALAKPSGIATATRSFVVRAGEHIRVVSGAWKKMPAVLKDAIRKAVLAGGGHFRMVDEPFVYLDKNYVRMLGGIRSSLRAVAHLNDHKKVVQVRGAYADIGTEARAAAEEGADVIFVDTGSLPDLYAAAEALDARGRRPGVKIAFGGSVRLEDLEQLRTMPVDILDIGRPIIDAPLLDLRMEVTDVG